MGLAEPFLGEIRLVAFNFPPRGWALCNGQFLPIAQNPALFSLLGTTYGGDGQTTFALPDLRGRAPVHFGDAILLGQQGGEAAHTLIAGEMPEHTHELGCAAGPGNAASPAGNVPAADSEGVAAPYSTGPPTAAMLPGALASVGGSQAHENMPPYLALNYVIALQGIFPSES